MTDYVEGIPMNGDIRHAISPESVRPDRRYAWGRALCGVRGRDSMGMGGMRPQRGDDGELIPFTATDPNPDGKVGWDNRTMNTWCPKCIRAIARLKKRAASLGEEATA